jgi:hypothetical protein
MWVGAAVMAVLFGYVLARGPERGPAASTSEPATADDTVPR